MECLCQQFLQTFSLFLFGLCQPCFVLFVRCFFLCVEKIDNVLNFKNGGKIVTKNYDATDYNQLGSKPTSHEVTFQIVS